MAGGRCRLIAARLAVVLGLALGPVPGVAGPFAPPGDGRLRSDIETMRAAGLITGPIDTWPLAWRQINRALERADLQPLRPEVAAAVRRVRALSERNRRPHRVELKAALTDQPALVRDFAAGARSEGDLSFRGEGDIGPFTLTLGASWNSMGSPAQPATVEGTGLTARPSQAALVLGNVGLYGGYTDVWWGPSREAGLLFSTSARAFPKLGAKLLEPKPIDLPVLRWLGPLRFD
ncbi:MAG: capsule assembly Wzi family protein, partial [Thermaurantiacus sp.]